MSTTIEHIELPSMRLTGAPLSSAVAAGDFVFCAGQVGFKAGTNELVEGGIGPQTRQAMENVAAVLEAAGSSLDRIVKVIVFLGDAADFQDFNREYATFFEAGRFPARTTVTAGFAAPGIGVELVCVAVRSS
jgi:2-iminobutanoate/2-iminopropanoate deaminase